jgi:hypothetical protein
MCPVCVTTAVLTTAGAATGAGVVALVVGRWRDLSRWFGSRARGA